MFKKILLILLIIAIGFIAYIANGFFGNPISAYLSKKSTIKYVEEKYGGQGFVLDRSFYNFKNGSYINRFIKPGSEDEVFNVDTNSLGKIKYDSYKSDIAERFNTYRRLDSELRKYTDPILNKNFNLVDKSFAFVSILKEEMDNNSFELNQKLDISDPSMEKEIAMYLDQEDTSYTALAELILKIEDVFDKEGIKLEYYTVNIRNRIDEEAKNNPEVGVYDLKYEDWKANSASVEELAKFLEEHRNNWDRIHENDKDK